MTIYDRRYEYIHNVITFLNLLSISYLNIFSSKAVLGINPSRFLVIHGWVSAYSSLYLPDGLKLHNFSIKFYAKLYPNINSLIDYYLEMFLLLNDTVLKFFSFSL